ncbi:MAG: ABC transporter ATP-binding protein [Rhodobacterales bacterium]|nr:ABC transporter ATP-binding protein [Rhodobacterales bacterium]
MESSIFGFIFKHSRRQQVFLLLLTLVSFPFLYASLDLPKTIINEAVGGGVSFPRALFGIQSLQLEQIDYLMTLCGIFLGLVLINGGFKYWINVYKGQMGERMLRRLRYILFARILRFPLPQFRKTSQGELIAMITAEVEPLGGFIGDAIATPAFQGGTLLTILGFIMIQDPFLGVASIALYPVQMILIPRLQRRVNLLGKERVKAVRKLSEQIGEVVSGIQEVRANDTSEFERARFARQVGAIFEIRYLIYRKKFFIKFLNNFIAQVTPFLFYSVGGYLVITGDLTFGALVAVLAAYKDLASPWKELLSWYQTKEDARIKYEQLVDQFHPAGMIEEDRQDHRLDPVPHLEGAVVATNLSLEEDGGIKVVDGATFRFDSRSAVAITGPAGAGKAGMARLLARLLVPTGGNLRIGDAVLPDLPEPVTGRRMAYVGQSIQLFNGTVRDNLVYGLKHRPGPSAERDGDDRAAFERYVVEAQASGNTESDPDSDWVDYDGAGVPGPTDLADRLVHLLGVVGMDGDIYALGLQGSIDPERYPDLCARVLEARTRLRERMEGSDLAKTVEPFERTRYNDNMTVAENLLFGTPIGDAFMQDRMADNTYVRQVLHDTGLEEVFLQTGLQVASIMLELFQDLPPDHEFFDRYSFVSADDLPEVQAVVRRAESLGGVRQLESLDRRVLMSLPFKLIPARHRLGLLDDDLKARILEARRRFAEGLPAEFAGAVAFYDQDSYNAAASVQDNILFGRLVYGRQQGHAQVNAVIAQVVDDLDLRRTLMEAGLDFQVGIGGARLSNGQRQRLGLARALLKRPDMLVVDQALAALDPVSQTAVLDRVFDESAGRGIVWVLGQAEMMDRFDTALVMEGGKISRSGPARDVAGDLSGVAAD